MRRQYFCGLLALASAVPMAATAALQVAIIEGLGGSPAYTEQFRNQVQIAARASLSLTANDRVHVFRGSEASREAILAFFADLQSSLTADDQIAIYLIGHGSYDDYEYKFNLPGPDLSGEDLADVLDNLPTSRQLIVNTGSASGAVLELLKRDNRVLIVATRSGVERHATRFGGFFTEALTSTSADTDKNALISAEEAFRYAERKVRDYYESNGQLSTEHPRIEGSRTERLTLARLGAKRPTSDDAELRALLDDRDALNADIDALRQTRDQLSATDYQSQLLEKMLRLARIEDSIEAREQEQNDDD